MAKRTHVSWAWGYMIVVLGGLSATAILSPRVEPDYWSTLVIAGCLAPMPLGWIARAHALKLGAYLREKRHGSTWLELKGLDTVRATLRKYPDLLRFLYSTDAVRGDPMVAHLKEQVRRYNLLMVVLVPCWATTLLLLMGRLPPHASA